MSWHSFPGLALKSIPGSIHPETLSGKLFEDVFIYLCNIGDGNLYILSGGSKFANEPYRLDIFKTILLSYSKST